MEDNKCLFCNSQIPEGRQVCPNCERELTPIRKYDKGGKQGMFNKTELKVATIRKGLSFEDLAKTIGVTLPSFYRKINRDGDFSRNEIIAISKKLELTEAETHFIFFA